MVWALGAGIVSGNGVTGVGGGAVMTQKLVAKVKHRNLVPRPDDVAARLDSAVTGVLKTAGTRFTASERTREWP